MLAEGTNILYGLSLLKAYLLLAEKWEEIFFP